MGGILITIKDNYVTAALDLSRASKEVKSLVVAKELKRSFFLGREIDLLEVIRRQDNPEGDFFQLSFAEMELNALNVGIDPILLEANVIPNFVNEGFIDYIDKEKFEIKFTDIKSIYKYSKNQIANFNSKERDFLGLIDHGMIKPVDQDFFDKVILEFPDYATSSLKSYLDKTRILSPIQAQESIFYSSPKIYKHKEAFRRILESNPYGEVTRTLEFLNENPGIPIESLDSRRYNHDLIKGLTIAGAVDSISLNIDGESKKYITPTNLNPDRYDNDHLDQVKKTLANFRFGERYSKWTLSSLNKFLESMLDRGYAGKATPIGTDYKNLEASGIVKVSRVTGDQYRFWMLKKDVIEDTLKVLRGSVPYVSRNPTINLHEMDNATISRIIISENQSSDVQEFTEAMRKIQKGIQ